MPKYNGLPSDIAMAYRQGKPDANGCPPEHQISDGTFPCRCCPKMIPPGADTLVLAYRPFERLQPYAETGPIFLCAEDCAHSGHGVPDVIASPEYLLKAYSADERIIYGTGKITPKDQVASYADLLLQRPDVAFVDLRSARNNCWQVRMTR